MGTEANKETVRRMFDEVINNGKLDRIEDYFHPDFVTNTPQGSMDRDGFRDYVGAWRAGFGDIHCEVGDFVAEDDLVSWSVRATGTHTGDFNGIPPTGKSVDFLSLNVGRFAGDGRAVEHTVVMDVMTMLTQMGVIPALAE